MIHEGNHTKCRGIIKEVWIPLPWEVNHNYGKYVWMCEKCGEEPLSKDVC